MCFAREVVHVRGFGFGRDIAAFPLAGTGPFNGKCFTCSPSRGSGDTHSVSERCPLTLRSFKYTLKSYL